MPAVGIDLSADYCEFIQHRIETELDAELASVQHALPAVAADP